MWTNPEILPKVSPLNDHDSFSTDDVFDASGDTGPEKCANIFLPGWGLNGKIITLQNQKSDWLFPRDVLSPAETIRAVSDYFTNNKSGSVTLTGWSMGAYLALDIALRFPKRIRALYLLAMRASWPVEEIEFIRNELRNNRNSFLHTFYRKCFLGYKEQYSRFMYDIEESLISGIKDQVLEEGLDYLAGYDTGTTLPQLKNHVFPTYLINGAKDIIAPLQDSAVGDEIISLTMPHGGHPVFLDGNFPFHLHQRKDAIRRKFSRAATTYDSTAVIQKKIAVRLGEALPDKAPAHILEVGCGTGNYTRIIAEKFPDSTLTALDFSEQMIEVAERKTLPNTNINYLCCDGEDFLRDSNQRFDLITSNATMQWFDNLATACQNLKDRLKPEGDILLSIFGPSSMKEMREGLRTILGREVSLPSSFFPDHEQLCSIFKPLFRDFEIDERQTLNRYNSITDLLNNIRKTGTSGWHPGRLVLTEKRITELENWFFAEYGKCCITYQIFQISGKNKSTPSG